MKEFKYIVLEKNQNLLDKGTITKVTRKGVYCNHSGMKSCFIKKTTTNLKDLLKYTDTKPVHKVYAISPDLKAYYLGDLHSMPYTPVFKFILELLNK